MLLSTYRGGDGEKDVLGGRGMQHADEWKKGMASEDREQSTVRLGEKLVRLPRIYAQSSKGLERRERRSD